MTNWLNVPISFWGKVVDEEGLPIGGASVRFLALDKPMEQLARGGGTQHAALSDMNGFFSVTNLNGAALYVEVSKRGYSQIDESAYIIGYSFPNDRKQPSATEPAIFVLRRVGVAEPLKVFTSGGIRVPKDGKPIEIGLTEGRVASGQGDIVIEVWTQDKHKDEQGRYPWRCRISVPGGGLIERTDPFNYFAPADGYSTSTEFSMDPTDAGWKNRLDRHLFVKLKDGVFARVALTLATSGDHFVIFETHLNPRSGSRNLYDDRQQASISQ